MAIKGIPIELTVRTKIGEDDLNAPVYKESVVIVDNVLVGEPSSEDVIDELSLSGKHIAYVLGIPKNDEHNWTDTTVRFWGETFRTIGIPTQGIEDMIPLSWNKKVKVERYE